MILKQIRFISFRFLKFLQEVVGEETVTFLFVWVGRLISLGGCDGKHVAFGGANFCFNCNTTCCGEHVPVTIGSTKAGVQKYYDRF